MNVDLGCSVVPGNEAEEAEEDACINVDETEYLVVVNCSNDLGRVRTMMKR
jgi:hypothetical protein